MSMPKDPARRCHGTNNAGKPCGRAPIRGGFVCRSHGGGAPQVRRKAAERLADLIDPDRVLRTAAALAYADVTDVYDDEYKLKPLKDWPPEFRQAVKRLEPRLANVDPGDGAADKVLRLEMHDKIKPLEMLMKHLQLLTEKIELSGGIDIAQRLAAGRQRVAEARKRG